MKKISFAIVCCVVSLSLFSSCTDNNCNDCYNNANKESKSASKPCAKANNNINVPKEEVKMITTDSGLKYEILTEGKGTDTPEPGQTVTVHYTGWLDNNGEKGFKFDSSVDRGTPFKFTIGVGQVIKGWDEGVASMKIGEKRKLIIPSDLGYGTTGAGGIIPGNATLIFEVELLKIV